MLVWVLVACGGALGSMGRYAVGQALTGLGLSPVLGTLAANLSGSFLIGVIMTLLLDRAAVGGSDTHELRLFLVVGLLGGYTTFSSLAWDTTRLLRDGALLRAMLNGAGSLAVGIVAVFAGIGCARLILRA